MSQSTATLRRFVVAAALLSSTSAACGELPAEVTFNVDSSGATLSLLDGDLQLVIPPRALDSSLTITAERRNDVPTTSNLVGGSAVDLLPDGIRFAVPCTVKVRYANLSLPAGLVESTLHLRRLDEFTGQWQPVVVNTVDTQAKRVTAVLNGFSTYGLFGEVELPPLPPPSDTSYPNQPGGFITLYNRPFSALSEQGWAFRDYSQTLNNVQGTRIAIVTDTSARRSGPDVLQITYPAGYAGGGEPAKTGREFPSSEFGQSMYTSLWVKFSSNWDGHMSSVNKIVYWQMTLDPNFRARLFLLGRGTDAQNLRADLVTQGTPIGDQRLLPPNLVPNAQFVRGRWHRVEVLTRLNSGENFDGQVHMWLDGTKITEYNDVIFVRASELHMFTGFEVTPVWGGTGDVVGSQAQYMWFDHLYISRSP